MAMSMAGGKGGGGRRRGRRRGGNSGLISEINVTPMVDVMLVLLIIFMVAADRPAADGGPADEHRPEAGDHFGDQ